MRTLTNEPNYIDPSQAPEGTTRHADADARGAALLDGVVHALARRVDEGHEAAENLPKTGASRQSCAREVLASVIGLKGQQKT